MRRTLPSILAAGLLLCSAVALAQGPARYSDAQFIPAKSKKELVEKVRAGAVLPVSAVPATEDAGDYYVQDGRKIALLRAKNEVGVRYKTGVTAARGFEALKASGRAGNATLVTHCKPAQLDIVRSGVDAGGKMLQGGALRDAVALDANVSQVFPVYVNAADSARMVATDEILLCAKSAADVSAISSRLASVPATVVRREPAKNAHILLVRLADPGKTGALDACRAMAAWPGVKWAEPNWVRELFMGLTPNDPMYPQQQSHNNTGQNGAVSDADADAPEAWNVSTGSSSVVIAIIDDGVDTAHADLSIQPGGYDFYNGDSDPSPVGTDGHGTGCAGVAAAIGNNGYRISGIAPACRILPVKISEGSFATDTVIANAIQYAADRADVLSNSWGGGGSSSAINTAVDYSISSGRGGKGSPVFFASGNSASGWYRGGGRARLSTGGLSGSYTFAFDYYTETAGTAGLNTVYVDNVCLIQSNQYTHTWRQDFEGTFPPAGWTLVSSGGVNWYNTTTYAYTGTAGSNSPRAGAIGEGQWTDLRTPLQAVTGTETLAFAYYTSTSDSFYVDVYNSGGTYLGSYGPWTGVPSITPPVAYPANYANTIAVGTATDCDRRADYSQYGPELDFLAPSNGGWNDIVTLDPTGAVGWNATDYKYNFGGTSSACPLAAGMAALRLTYNPAETAAGLRSWMRAHCDKVGPLAYSGGEAGAGGRNDQYGYGRLNSFMVVPVTVSGFGME